MSTFRTLKHFFQNQLPEGSDGSRLTVSSLATYIRGGKVHTEEVQSSTFQRLCQDSMWVRPQPQLVTGGIGPTTHSQEIDERSPNINFASKDNSSPTPPRSQNTFHENPTNLRDLFGHRARTTRHTMCTTDLAYHTHTQPSLCSLTHLTTGRKRCVVKD